MDYTITNTDIIIRLCLGFLAGGIIGFERSSRRQVAGLRTHIIIALGATGLMLVSIWLPQQMSNRGDPGRIAAQVVSGIGFLGAGAIIRLGNNIRGLTTAASLWLVAAIGMIVGAGMYLAAAVVEILSLIALILLSWVEKRIFPELQNKTLEVLYNHSVSPDTEAVLKILKSHGIKTMSQNVILGHASGKKTRARFLVGIPNTNDISKLANTLKASDDIRRIEIKEKF